MNRSLARSLLLGVILLIAALLLRAACVPLGPWQTAVVLRGGTPVEAEGGPALVWVVPVLERARVYDLRTRTVTGAVPWVQGGTKGVSPEKGTLAYAGVWRITNPLRYAKLGREGAARRAVAARLRSALLLLLKRVPAGRLLRRGDLRPELGGLEKRFVPDGVAIVSVWGETLRWSAGTLRTYVALRKKTWAARLAADRKRDAAERALLAARESAERARVLAAARRAARLARARTRARALAQELVAARPAPAFFAYLVRLEILDRALVRPTPVVRLSAVRGTHGPR